MRWLPAIVVLLTVGCAGEKQDEPTLTPTTSPIPTPVFTEVVVEWYPSEEPTQPVLEERCWRTYEVGRSLTLEVSVDGAQERNFLEFQFEEIAEQGVVTSYFPIRNGEYVIFEGFGSKITLFQVVSTDTAQGLVTVALGSVFQETCTDNPTSPDERGARRLGSNTEPFSYLNYLQMAPSFCTIHQSCRSCTRSCLRIYFRGNLERFN